MSFNEDLRIFVNSSSHKRLDCALVARGLAESRTIAKRLIQNGAVNVNNKTIKKSSFLVEDSEEIVISKSEGVSSFAKYVSRGALKLEGAFEAFSKYGLSTSKSTR
ncbi:TlyA family rRNA (cytidine-2'-O)-methyltransferase, partial [Bifidobacteriaceae bacterium NR003]